MSLVWPWIAVALTLIVLSRAFGDNPLFRASQYFFVGLSLGYTATFLMTDVLINRIEPAVRNATQGQLVDPLLLLVPIVLGLMLWTRLGGQQLSWVANFPLAFMFGAAAALALTGTIVGTLLPQIKVFAQPGNQLIGSGDLAARIGQPVVFVGSILVLLSFSFTRSGATASPDRRRVVATIGRWWLIVSLGIFFAGALITYQSALIERIDFLTRTFGLR